MIPDSFIQKVKDMNDISDVLGQFIHLEKKGKNAWACCPFHVEKTPSFAVSLQSQTYKCFGCGERGNVISFLMKYQHMSFVEAIEYLAKRVNLDVPQSDDPLEREKRRRQDTLLACMKTAARYYFNAMNTPEGNEYLSYWYSRRLSADTIRYFGLGASPDAFGVLKHLEQKGFDSQTMIAAGIAEEKNGRLLDAEHHRCIVPIFDVKGAVVAFGGRILEAKGFAKYKNTPGTEVFFKSLVLYNLNRFREQGAKNAILVEGYMDVISLYQAGFTNAVAPMGTSFTDEQCAALKRYADTVYVTFDGDFAGRKATLAAIDKLRKLNFEIRVVTEPEELDPDDVIKKYGAEGFQKCLDEALPWIDYKLKTIEAGFDLKSLDGRAKYSRAATEFLMELDVVTREVYFDKVAEKANIAREALSQSLRGKDRKRDEPTIKVEVIPEKKQEDIPKDGKISAAVLSAARYIVAAFVKIRKYDDMDVLKEEFLPDENLKKIYRYVLKCREDIRVPQESDVYDILLGSEEAKRVFEEFEAIPLAKEGEHFSACAKILARDYKDSRRKVLTKSFQEAKTSEEKNKIKEELQNLD